MDYYNTPAPFRTLRPVTILPEVPSPQGTYTANNNQTLSQQVQEMPQDVSSESAQEATPAQYLKALEDARLDARRPVPSIPLNIDEYSKNDLLALHKALKGFNSPNARYNVANLKEIGIQTKVIEQIIRKNHPDTIEEAGISLNEGDVPASEFITTLKDFSKPSTNPSQPLPPPPDNLNTYTDEEIESVTAAYLNISRASDDKKLQISALRYYDVARSEVHRRVGVPMKQPSFMFNPLDMTLLDFDKLLKSQQDDVDLYKRKGFNTLYEIEKKTLEVVQEFREQRADGTLDLNIGMGKKPKPTLPEETDRIKHFAKRHEQTGSPFPTDESGQPRVPIYDQLLPYPGGGDKSDVKILRTQQEEVDKAPGKLNQTALANQASTESPMGGVVNISDAQGNPVNDEVIKTISAGTRPGLDQFLASK